MSNKLLTTINQVHQRPAILPFNGQSLPSAGSWINQLEIQFTLRQIEKSQWPREAACLLTDGALQWFVHMYNIDQKLLESWEHFKTLFLKEFESCTSQRDLRRQISTIRQNGSDIMEHISKFRTLINQVSDMNQIHQVEYFTASLDRPLRQRLIESTVETLVDAISLATRTARARQEVLRERDLPSTQINAIHSQQHVIICRNCNGYNHYANQCPSPDAHRHKDRQHATNNFQKNDFRKAPVRQNRNPRTYNETNLNSLNIEENMEIKPSLLTD